MDKFEKTEEGLSFIMINFKLLFLLRGTNATDNINYCTSI
jgi:hypothetical protein